jgi:serine/threonine-protein kinase PknG
MRCAEPGCAGAVAAGYCELCGTAPASEAPNGQTQAGRAWGGSASRSVSTARAESSKSAATRGHLGLGMVAIPRIPKGNPARAVLDNPSVPEGRRFCGNSECNQPVGRARDGRPGLAEGFCTQCGTRYSFVPKLSHGDVVGGQYEVQGCIAHGGLGWIYLAIDRNVHNRWVVLKGLLNSGDADAMAAAAAEVLTLSEVEHPNIVRIYNFIEHVDATGVTVGYIVMEYVAGTTLKQIRNAHNGPLPPDQAVAYIVEIAPALDYLHTEGFAYCDFKPDNVMQSDEQLKLIDLGAVVAMDDPDSAIYGTLGYQAPEIARTGPTVASDVYTVGRTLAVLLMDVPHRDGRFADRLPGPADNPVLARYESLHRAIMRATDPDPARRFPSMADMTDQLTGVLHEIAAATTGIAQPRKSRYFSPQRAVYGVGSDSPVDPARVVAALPVPVVNPDDPGAAVLATTSGTPPAQLEYALDLARGGVRQLRRSSVEVPLRLVRASIEIGAVAAARTRIAELASVIPADWRLRWYSGQCALLNNELDVAAEEFDAVLGMLPGELGVKLAIAATAELRGAHDAATGCYQTIWHTEHSYFSAAFGLARGRVRAGDRAAAIEPLDEIPVSSAHHTAAGVAAIGILLDERAPNELNEQTLLAAGKRAAALTVESSATRARLRLKVFGAALDWLHDGNDATAQQLLGVHFTGPGIKVGMERCYRELARHSIDTWERITLVEKANAIRPRTRL